MRFSRIRHGARGGGPFRGTGGGGPLGAPLGTAVDFAAAGPAESAISSQDVGSSISSLSDGTMAVSQLILCLFRTTTARMRQRAVLEPDPRVRSGMAGLVSQA